MIEAPLNIISERESFIYIKLLQDKNQKDSEYIINNYFRLSGEESADHMVILVQFWPDSVVIFHQEQLDLL
jgi:hypothetical protein